MAGVLLLSLVLLFTGNETVIYAAVGLMGFGMACVFATFYAVATRAVPEQANEVAGLMILAISAGALPGPGCWAVFPVAGHPPSGLLFFGGLVGVMLLGALTLYRRCKQKWYFYEK